MSSFGGGLWISVWPARLPGPILPLGQGMVGGIMMDDRSQARRSADGQLGSRAFSCPVLVLCGAALYCAGFGAPTLADDIYKWQDRDGVHFGSRPPPGGAERVKTAPAPQPTGDTQERSQRTQRMLDAYADERQEQSATRQKKQTERKERQQRCQEAKTRQLEYAAASYIYVTDAQGNRRIVDDTERGRMQTDADAAVAKWCR